MKRKKTYIQPTTDVVCAESHTLLTGSGGSADDGYDLGNNNQESGGISTDGPDISQAKGSNLWAGWDD